MTYKLCFPKQSLRVFLSSFFRILSFMFYIYRSVIDFKLIFIFGIRYELRFLVLFIIFASVQFSHSVVSDSLQPLAQPARPPCPSPTPGVHPNPYIQLWHHLLQRLCPFQLIAFTRLSEINCLTCVGLLFVLSVLPHWSTCLSFCQHNPVLTVRLSLEIMWCELS